MSDHVEVGSTLEDTKVSVRIQLAVLWICHFILWIFGDMFSLVQDMTEPATEAWVEVVAPSTAIVLTLVVAYTLVGRPSIVRLITLIVAPVYLLFNIGFFVDATEAWEYYLGIFYVLFIVLIMVRAWTWPRTKASASPSARVADVSETVTGR